MDNRPGVMKVSRKGRRVIIGRDIVSAAVGDADHFKFSDIGKGIAKGVTKFTTKDPAKERQKLAEIDAKYAKLEASPMGKIGNTLAGLGLGAVAALTGAKALTGGFAKAASSVVKPSPKIDTSAMAGEMLKKPVLVKSMTPTISPLPPSVPSTPGDANITAAMEASERNPGTGWLGDAITRAAEKLPPELRNEITQRGRELAESGKKTVLSKAQKALSELSASGELLPKTKALKDAESLLLTPQHAAGDASSVLGGMSSTAMLGLGLAIAGILAAMYFGNK